MVNGNTAGYKRILVLQWGGLGSASLASALLEDLHRAYPEAELHLSVRSSWCELYHQDPRFTGVYPAPVGGASILAGASAWFSLLKKLNVDLVIDLTSSRASRSYLSLARLASLLPAKVVGMNSSFPYTMKCGPTHPKVHLHTCMQAPFMGLSVPHRTAVATFHVTPESRAQALTLLSESNVPSGRFAIFIPGSAAHKRSNRWSVASYTRLATLLLARNVSKILILGGPDERDACQQVAAAIGNDAVNLCEKVALPLVPCIAARAFVTVSNSTGLAHLVSAAGTPLWVLFGRDMPERYKPLGSHVKTMRVDPHLFTRMSAAHAMSTLSADQVANDIFESLLGDKSSRPTGWL